MSKRIIHLLLAVSLGLNVGVISTTLVHRAATPPPGPRPGGGEPRPERPDPARLVEGHVQGMTQHLDLDAGQQEAIRNALEPHAAELASLQAQVAEAGRRLSSAFAASEFDHRGFLRLTAETSTVRARLDSLSAVLLVAEAAVLNPEQRLKFSNVASIVHTQPQQPPRAGGPQQGGGPPRDGGPPPR